ncbi:hypothetical protein QCA50_011793 [Cerrena zonata]|uniref:Uncharacterized protein n=1 Tax=Cerrena zonata TaxID=2478898 RepID=A0AAW0FV57_9APHY
MCTLYVRFGQTVLQDCEHCSTFDEYALYALPWTVLGYIREAATIGALTIQGSGRERWRTYGVAAIVVTAVVEGYWVATATVRIPRDGLNVYMLHDNLWFFRHLIFLLVPVAIHLLPAAPPNSDPYTLLQNTRSTMDATMARLTSLKYLRGAVMRDPATRESADSWWTKQKVEGEWIREDENVQRVAEKLGFGFAGHEGTAKLKSNAKATVGVITQGPGIEIRTAGQ